MNNEIEAVPFHTAHLDLLQLREVERGTMTREALEALANASIIRTFTIDGRILCLAGLHALWENTAEVFVIPSIYVAQYHKQFNKEVKQVLDDWQEIYTRLQTSSVDDAQTNSWMQYLGFECEGTMRKYSRNGLDYRMWARVK